jgi:indolepyruvate ferredoxin oxidoreductase beta subunit
MKNDIIISGVGGQGIVSIAGIIGLAAVANNLYIKQSEVHGMSQRGGDVISHCRLSDKPIASDLVTYGKVDLVISVEPMEALRYQPWLSSKGQLVTNSVPFINIPNYTEVDLIIEELKKHNNTIILDADAIAKEAGSIKASNVVVLGAASPYIDIPYSSIEQAVKTFFEKKGEEVVAINLKALKAGRELAKKSSNN